MPARPARRLHPLTAIAALLSLVLLSACSVGSDSGGSGDSAEGAGATTDQVSRKSEAAITSSVPRGAKAVQLEKKVRLRVAQGTFSEVSVTTGKGAKVAGRLSADKTRYVVTDSLMPGTRYRVTSRAVDADGLATAYQARFRTRSLSLDEQTYPSFFPSDGATVGVGMPVSIRFDVPVTDKASIEKHLKVTTQPAQVGSFYWVSTQEVRWRPKSYWKPGTKVEVDADIGGVPAGGGIYGQEDRSSSFTVGRSMISTVNIATHQMQVRENGKLIRTIPITTGEQPKFTTRSGVKVITEKYRSKRMNSETIGINPDSADGYDLDDVEYAMRVTNTGEFIHAAPWSVGSQGYANVSHGCTGMSTSNAEWFYSRTMIGDVVTYTGSDRGTDLTNGFGDWNTPFWKYKQGSAL